MAIYKNSDANVVNTVDNVTKKLDELRQDNPDYTFTITNESASYIRNSLHNTLQTLIEGLCTTGWSCSSSSGAGDRRWPS